MEIQSLRAAILDFTEKLDSVEKSLQNIDVETVEGLNQHTSTRKELVEVLSLSQNLQSRFAGIVQKETSVIEDSLKKKEETLALVRKSLLDVEEPEEPEKVKEKFPPKNERKWADIASQNGLVTKTILGKNGVISGKDKLIARRVAEGVYIPMYTIDEPSHCNRKEYLGWWCYCVRTGRMNISINGEIITALCCSINNANDVPVKFLEHKACASGSRNEVDFTKTSFYVPPELVESSDDVRQLTNRSYFVPGSQQAASNQKYAYRIGCRDSLSADLNAMEGVDFRLFKDMAGSFMLVLTAANQEMKRRNSKSGI